MRHLGGWSRLGIVISVLYAICIASVGYLLQPDIDSVYEDWYWRASEIVAAQISEEGEKDVEPYVVKKALFDRSRQEHVEWLNGVAEDPTEQQAVISEEIKEANKKFQERVREKKQLWWQFWGVIAGLWAGGTVFLFLLGATIGWVYRGFKNA